MINFHPDQSFRKLSESAWWPLGRGVYLGVKTSEIFPRCFLSNIFLGSIVLTSHWPLCIHCFTSLVSFIGFYTEDELICCLLGVGKPVFLYVTCDQAWKMTEPILLCFL